MSLLDEMAELGCPPGSVTFASAMLACERAGQWQHVLRIMDQVHVVAVWICSLVLSLMHVSDFVSQVIFCFREKTHPVVGGRGGGGEGGGGRRGAFLSRGKSIYDIGFSSTLA